MNQLQGTGKNSRVTCQELTSESCTAGIYPEWLPGTAEPEHQQPQQERDTDDTIIMHNSNLNRRFKTQRDKGGH